MIRISQVVLLTTLLVLCPAAAGAADSAPEPLSLDAALAAALAGHPEVAAADGEVAGAQAAIVGARALPSPEVAFTPAGRVDDAQFSVLQPLDTNGRRRAEAAAARERLSAAQAQLQARRHEVAFRVRTAFYEALAAQQERDGVAQTVALLEQIRQAAQKSFALGNTPESHVVRTRIEVTRIRQELRLAEGEVGARLAALNAAMGRDAALPLTLAGELPKPVPLPDPEGARAVAQRQRPELGAAQAAVRAREAETRVRRTGLRPDVALQAQRESLLRGGGSLGVTLTLPFLDWGRRRSEIQQSEAAAAAERAHLAQEQNEVGLDVAESLARLQAAARVVEEYDKGILADAERLASITRTGYEEGALSYLEVLDAQRTLAETRRSAIQARCAYAKARVSLERAIGAPVP